jgi:hypothetical protein
VQAGLLLPKTLDPNTEEIHRNFLYDAGAVVFELQLQVGHEQTRERARKIQNINIIYDASAEEVESTSPSQFK